MNVSSILGALAAANADFARLYPGEAPGRQPVHTYYEGAHRFRADTVPVLGEQARAALERFVPDGETLARVFGLEGDASTAARVHDRVRRKLETEPVEDLRVDFEDGYGTRPDAEEDATAVAAAEETARAWGEGALPPFVGIRIKPMFDATAPRALRTTERFVTRMLEETGGALPDGFVITLTKIVSPEQVAAAVRALDLLERERGLPAGALRVELMFETTQSILAPDGRVAVRDLVSAAEGRCRGAHFGVYDYTASCSITAQHQSMQHPACDFARHAMQVALAGTGVTMSDGATNVLPASGEAASVQAALQAAYDDTRRSLRHAVWQGWDLHPAQLVARHAAVTSFYLEGLEAVSGRLRSLLQSAARATRAGDVHDDAATGQGLFQFFRRGFACGAITEGEASAAGLTPEEIRTGSFADVLARRTGPGDAEPPRA